MRGVCILLILLIGPISGYSQKGLKIAKLKYNGGGDWYANKTALPNLIAFCNKELGMNLSPEEEVAEVEAPVFSTIPIST
jgi:hypothetical protein